MVRKHVEISLKTIHVESVEFKFWQYAAENHGELCWLLSDNG